MKKDEKIMICTSTVMVGLLILSICLFMAAVEDSGGLREIIICIGREIKDIFHEIAKE